MLLSKSELFEPVFKAYTKNVMVFVFVLMVIFGIVGNLINVLVFMSQSLRKSLTFAFISLLSLIDMLILVVSLFETIFETYFNTEIRLVSTFFCKLDTFLVHFLLHIRNIVFMTIAIYSICFFLNYFLGP
jgi:hypothetical protein